MNTTTIEFAQNDYPTLGVEVELQLVGEKTFRLESVIGDVLAGVPAAMNTRFKNVFRETGSLVEIVKRTVEVGLGR